VDSRTDRDDLHDFLLLRYKELDFLVDRYQFSASTSLDRMRSARTPFPYLSHYSWFNNQRVLLFDLNRFIKETYRCQEEGLSQLCLIMRMEDFTQRSARCLKKILRLSDKISQEYIGLIVTSLAEIHPVEISRIHLSPPGLQPLLIRRGLYGSCFPEESRIQYLVDLQKLLFLSLEQSSGTSLSENPLMKELASCL